MNETCDLFLTHAWRYHDDWKHMVDVLNGQGFRTWRNFSLPWYDPALDPRTPEGGRIVRRHLENQIIPCHAVVLLSGVYEQVGCRKWVDMEIEMARQHGKPIIGVPATAASEPTAAVRELSDVIVAWDGAAIIAAARKLRSHTVPATR